MFSADQMDVRGGGNVFIRRDEVQEHIIMVLWMVSRNVIFLLCCAAEEDAEWQISESPTSVIGHSNGDEGLAQPMLEVNKTLLIITTLFCRFCVILAIWSILVIALQLQINDQRFEDAEEMVHESETKDH